MPPVEQPAVVQRVESYQLPVRPQAQAARQNTAAAAKAERPDPLLVKLPAGARSPLGVRRGPGVPVQIGVARDVAATANGAMGRSLKWHPAAGRTATAVSFTSPGAAGLRLGLLVRKLPADALVRGYVQGGDTLFEVPGVEILEAIQRNRDAGDVSEASRTWWSPLVDGEEMTLEISLPPGVSPDSVDVSIPRLSHLQVKAQDLNDTAKIGLAGSCEVDVKCAIAADPAAEQASRATARMVFTVDAASYLCTGTLLNDSSSSGTPYFLTAHHCVSTQTTATSLITYWFYRATSCDSGVLDGNFRILRSGATLLFSSSGTDASLMRLNAAPPTGAVFSAWSIESPALGAAVAGIHHPEGDLQKYSQGALSAYANCTGVDAAESFSCAISDDASNTSFVNADWRSGSTEAGSSGSGLFAATGSSRYLVGQLYGGSANCTFRSGTSWYGRFDKAYFAGLSRWLSPSGAQEVVQRSPVYRFYNAGTGAHFFTTNVLERDAVIAGNPSFNYEGVAYYAYGSQIAGSAPVYRFYNTQTGRHFYTMSAAERDSVIGTAGFNFEGPAWYAQESGGGSASAVYRFYNKDKNAHFYTINAAEKDFLVQGNPNWALEGIAYYAWTAK